jgi:flagellar motor switch protein FliN/FliY
MNMTQHPQELLEHLRSVLTAALDAPVHLLPGTMGTSGWRVRVAGPAGPLLTITFDADGANALARALARPGASAAESPAPALHELCSHVVSEVAGSAADDIEVSPAEFVEWLPVQGVTVAGFRCEARATTVAVAIGRETATTADVRSAAAPSRAGVTPESARFGMLMDIDLPLVVRFGCTDMSLKALSRLGPGSLIDLSRAPEDPVEVLVGGRVVARGEVVVVSGSYGIRIVDVSEGRSQALGMEA